MERIIKIADKVTFINESTLKDFDEFFDGKYKDKLTIARFGSAILEKIKELNERVDKKNIKKELGIPTYRIVVTCGYNATTDQQHEKIISEFSKLLVVFPMTYGENVKKGLR